MKNLLAAVAVSALLGVVSAPQALAKPSNAQQNITAEQTQAKQTQIAKKKAPNVSTRGLNEA